jgi:hypothetical protein
MKLSTKYHICAWTMLAAFIIIPQLAFPICEGCCVCSVSAHLNDRVLLDFFFWIWGFFFICMSFIEEWAHGS